MKARVFPVPRERLNQRQATSPQTQAKALDPAGCPNGVAVPASLCLRFKTRRPSAACGLSCRGRARGTQRDARLGREPLAPKSTVAIVTPQSGRPCVPPSEGSLVGASTPSRCWGHASKTPITLRCMNEREAPRPQTWRDRDVSTHYLCRSPQHLLQYLDRR